MEITYYVNQKGFTLDVFIVIYHHPYQAETKKTT